jgi:thiamine biosynthesis lipoprotein ApbE
MADAMATAIMVLGPHLSRPLVKSLGLQMICILDSGEVVSKLG